MESNLIVWSLNQLKIGLWEDVRLPVGNTEVQNQWKYTPPAKLSSTSRKKLIEMTIEPVELRISISPHFKASRKIDLCYERNVALYCK